jgi:predicted ATPase
MGKSRLIWELQKRIHTGSTSPVRWLTAHCLSHFQNTSLYPMVRLWEQLLGFQADDSVGVRHAKLTNQLAHDELDSPAAIWLLSLLLGLPTDTPATETISQAQREQMRKLFVALLQKQAAHQPVVLVIEDLHWSDPSTVEWLGQSLDSLAAAPCLTLFTARPSFEPTWLSPSQEKTRLHLLSLHPLPPGPSAQIVADLAEEQRLDATIRQAIITQADGIPLAVEELTKTVLEQPLTPEGTNSPLPIPATLLDSLVARLDHLGVAKETAQWVSVLGREVAYPVLQICVPYDETRLQSDLARLIEAELVIPLPPKPQDREGRAAAANDSLTHYTFKHALVQEAAYVTMLKRTRQVYHRRIAETLERQFAPLVTAHPELIAHHYAQAGLSTFAAAYWIRSGEQATRQGATVEAKIFFDRALDALPPDDYEPRWQALAGRETALFFQGERVAQEADIVALRTLAETHHDAPRQAQAFIRQARFATSQADYRAQFAAAATALVFARQTGSVTLELEALAYKVTALIRLGERQDVAATATQIVTLAQTVTDDTLRAYALAAVAICYIESGDLADAAQALSHSLEAAQRAPIRHLDLEGQYYGHLGFTYAQMGLYPEARATLASGLERATLMGIGRYQAYHRLNDGFVVWRMGDLPMAIALEEQALADFAEAGEVFGAAACQTYLGYIYESAGDLARAEKYLAEAEAGFAAIGVEPDKFELQAVRARVALRQGQEELAGQLAQGVWHYLRHEGTEGLGSPSWLYVCLADVLERLEIPGMSLRELLEDGYRVLMQRAEKLSYTAWRHSFVQNVAENKALIERWEALQPE